MSDPLTRWHYRITWKSGRVGTTTSRTRIWDCYAHFTARFGRTRIATVEERYGLGEWTYSALLPTCQAEADAINNDTQTKMLEAS